MKCELLDNEMIEGVVQHMNEDHSDACLTIVQTLGNTPLATSAIMLGMDAEGVNFLTASASGVEKATRVAFVKPVNHAGQVRGHLVAMTKRARAVPGTEHE